MYTTYKKYEHPRNKKINLKAISSQKDKGTKLKMCVIALRRNPSEDIFNLFKNLYQSNIGEILDTFDIRCLTSLAQCFLSYGSHQEKLAAQQIVSLVMQEKIFTTIYSVYNLEIKHVPILTQFTIKGCDSIRLSYDEAPFRYIYNIYSSQTELLRPMLIRVLKTFFNDPKSSWYMLMSRMGFKLKSDIKPFLDDIFNDSLTEKGKHSLEEVSINSFHWKA